MKLRNKKIAGGVFLAASFFVLPWYVTVIFSAALMVYLPGFWFGVVLALAFDLAYSINPVAGSSYVIYGRFGVLTVVFFIAYLAVEFFRKQVRL